MIAKYAIAGLAGSALLASVAFAQSPSNPHEIEPLVERGGGDMIDFLNRKTDADRRDLLHGAAA